MMGFGSSFNMRISPVVKNLIIINLIMLIATMFARPFMLEKFALFYFGSDFFSPYQILTHIFMHGSFFHLFFNMYTLWIFGGVLENLWGSKKFFIYYLVTGIGAALLHEFVMYIQVSSLQAGLEAGSQVAMQAYYQIMATPTVGASGAVYGLLLAYGMIFPNNIMQLIFPPIALKAKWFVLIFGGIELFLGITNSGGNIAHFAHLGGMLFGLILILYWKKKNKLYS